MRLKNKIAIVTGASRGIGKSIAFADEGAHLVLVARSPNQLENVAGEIKRKGRTAIPVTVMCHRPRSPKFNKSISRRVWPDRYLSQ